MPRWLKNKKRTKAITRVCSAPNENCDTPKCPGQFFPIFKSDANGMGRFSDVVSGVISIIHFVKRPAYRR